MPLSGRKIYYGWWIVCCLLIAGIMTYGVGIYAFSLFINPLFDEFGWNRATMGGVVSIFWIGAPLVPLFALLIEKYGCRAVLILGVVIEATCLILVAYISSLWELYLLRALMGVGKVLVAVTLPIMVSYWFAKRFGMVVGIVFSGFHIGGVMWPPVTQYLIDASGWRFTAIILGVAMLVITIPVILLVLRVSRPEEIGLSKDGASDPGEADTANQQSTNSGPRSDDNDSGLSLSEATKNPTFWKIIIVTFIFYLGYSGILIHEATYVSEIGFSRQFGANLLGLTEFMALVAVLGFGALIDRYQPRFAMFAVLFLLAVSVTLLVATNYLPHTLLIYAFALLFGMAMGSGDVLWVVVLRSYFGQKHFERIYGVWYFVSLSTLFVAPILVGYFYDLTQSYAMAFIIILVSVCAGVALVSTIPGNIDCRVFPAKNGDLPARFEEK